MLCSISSRRRFRVGSALSERRLLKPTRHETSRLETPCAFFKHVAPSVSRVLLAPVREPDDHLSARSVTETLHGFRRAPPSECAWVGPTRLAASHGVASDRVYSKSTLPWKWVSSYLAFPSLPSEDGGLFLLPFSGGYPRLTLSVILPYDARTFLTGIPFGLIPRGRPTELLAYYNTIFTKCQYLFMWRPP